MLDSSAEPRRREARASITVDIPLRELGQTAVDATLVNISSNGFMAATEALIERGSRIWLTLPGEGRVNALVLWTRNGRVGGEFAEPIDPLAVLQAVGEQAI